MQVDEICNWAAALDPPRTPPREEAGANEIPSENNDNAEDNEATEGVVKIQKKITMSILAGGADVTNLNTFASIAAFGSGT